MLKICSAVRQSSVHDTEGVDLNVEICREYLNSYPAGFAGEEEKDRV